MSLSKTLLLGFIAGVTILIGLPLGRMRRPAPKMRVILNSVSVGILLFLVWDVLSAAWEPIDSAVGKFGGHEGGFEPVLGYGALFVGGLSLGLLSLVGYEAWMSRLARPVSTNGPTGLNFGPGAMARGEITAKRLRIADWSPAKRLALLIAVGIGLHNFAEGLAIGQAAASNEIALATLLVIGFGLHNATEGFGIVAPLAAGTGEEATSDRPSWRFLLTLGAIGGGPTFIGTAVGHGFSSEPVSVLFLTVAAGSIIYVVVQLLAVATKARRPDLLAYGLLIGLFAGFATDAVVIAAGI